MIDTGTANSRWWRRQSPLHSRATRTWVQSVAGQGNTTNRWVPAFALGALALAVAGQGGCGINKSRLATEQLVVSDAVDRAVAAIDFSPLSGHKVYFDTQFVKLGTGTNVEYVISSLRQQMLAYDCRLQEKAESADYIVEARVGALGYDGHEITYGVPGSAALGTASLFVGSPVPASALPELSLGRRNHQSGAAKIGLFAYDRQTREPVWQAGVTKGSSQARDLWIFGMGPYQQRSGSKPASQPMPFLGRKRSDPATDPVDSYAAPLVFRRAIERTTASPDNSPDKAENATVSHEAPLAEPNKLIPAPNAQPAAAANGGAKPVP